MEESSGRPPMGGVARRRRERRLRSMLRHEQQSIRMVLATVMHHSFKVHTENGAEPDHSHQGQRGRGPRAALRPTGTGATFPGDAASTAVGGSAAGGDTAAHRGPDRRRRSWVTDARWSCAAYGGTAGGRAPAL